MREFLEGLGALIELQAITYRSFRAQGMTQREAVDNAAALVEKILKINGGN